MTWSGPFLPVLEGAGHLAVVDLEATCGPGVVPKHNETIEIGAVMVRIGKDEPPRSVDEFQSFVSPVRSPLLTPFCTHLTSITQEMVDGAPRFPEVYRAFRAWMDRFEPVVFGQWGRYDARQLRRDCAYHGLEARLPPTLDLKKAFAGAVGERVKQAPGLARAYEMMGWEVEGPAHRGIHDARQVVRLLPRILGGGTGAAREARPGRG